MARVAVSLALAAAVLALACHTTRAYDTSTSDRSGTSTDDKFSTTIERRYQHDDASVMAEVDEVLGLAADDTAPPRDYCNSFRFVLSTVNQADQCVVFDSAPETIVASVGGAALDGLVVELYNVNDDQFSTAVFAGGAAVNGQLGWSVSLAADSFTNAWQVNLNNRAASRLVIKAINAGLAFDVLAFGDDDARSTPGTLEGRTSFDRATDLNEDGTLRGLYSLKVGVEGDRAHEDLFGVLTIRRAMGNQLPNTFSFLADVDQLESDPTPLPTLRPCAGRPRTVYGPSVVMTRLHTTDNTNPVLSHPTLYDRLLESAVDATNFAQFAQAARNASGRYQIVLRDLIFDAGRFSDLSANLHFTPCFRAERAPNFEVDLFALIQPNIWQNECNAAFCQRSIIHLTIDQNIFADELGCLATPAFVDFVGDRRRLFPIQEVVLTRKPGNAQGETSREIDTFDTDVRVHIESCPSFSYFA